MAIPFANVEYVKRSTGANACCKGAYNARTKIKDDQTGVTYNFQKRGGNVYHEILLPQHVDIKFKDTKVLMNEVEKTEKRKNSQLLKEYLLALPDEKNVSLELKKGMIYEFIKESRFIEEGLAVQIDIHKPDKDDKNWHAHLLVTTRRFTIDGKQLEKKARDLDPMVRGGPVDNYVLSKLITPPTEIWTNVQNCIFIKHGLENRVDLISEIPQEHIGPVRMRSVLNEAVNRNEERKLENIELLKRGEDVIARVTRGSSVFSKQDLVRAVKFIPNRDLADRLVLEALSLDKVIALYTQDGEESGLYTTQEVRSEELKLMRIGGYIEKQKNLVGDSSAGREGFINKIIDEDQRLNNQQKEALSHLLLGESGIRILKGRAGTGKSYVLGRVASIADYSRINVIGLSPTHKARQELERVGYKTCDTIKGFLFKLHNEKTHLPKNSLIVVDEAGMVGNDDYLELLRVASSSNCNVILTGDERQLSSVQRGGMFECFASRFGCAEMNEIQRQEVLWGKSVAQSFAEGDVRGGIGILKSNNRLFTASNKLESMDKLLNNWNNSIEPTNCKLIIAIKNADVDSLNQGARELLKAKGILIGPEISVTKDGKDFLFMNNDRIVFNQSENNLQVSNGDFGCLEEVSQTKFIVRMDNGNKIEFNPSEFSGFKHGYASTVYKAQGGSIRDVYVFHDGFSTNRNSYVAMSRHIKDLSLYTNSAVTYGEDHLIKQLSFNPEGSASINYYTKEDLAALELSKNKGLFAKTFAKVSSKLQERVTNFIDKNKVDPDYYIFEKPEVSAAEVEKILELVHVYQAGLGENANLDESVNLNEDVLELEEMVVVGGHNIKQSVASYSLVKGQNNLTSTITNKAANNKSLNTNNIVSKGQNFSGKTSADRTTRQRMTAKERFYASKEYLQNRAERQKIDYEQESIKLRQEVKWSAEKIARGLLGEPNKHLSRGGTLRFGGSGSFAVKIKGERSGSWYDFKEGRGGDLFDLVQERRNCDFKGAADYLRGYLGISQFSGLSLVNDHRAKEAYVDYYAKCAKENAEEEAKIRKVENLYTRSKEIDRNSVASRYLVKTRKIDLYSSSENILSKDIRTCSILDKSIDKRLPAIVAFARDAEGVITGGQQLLLDSKTHNKADIDTPRKSFGKIAGSFVEITNPTSDNRQNEENRQDKSTKSDNVTIIAEGLETALSISYAGIDAKIICALGISNIKNYVPKENERVIIAADNDGENAITNRTIDEASNILSGRGAVIRVVRPRQLGDFNDILQRDDIAGVLEIREVFEPVIKTLRARTLDEFFANPIERNKLTLEAQKDLSYISKYTIKEDKLLDEFKYSYDRGLTELSNTKARIIDAEAAVFDRYAKVFEDIEAFGGYLSKEEAVQKLIELPRTEALCYLDDKRNKAFHGYIETQCNAFRIAKEEAKNIQDMFQVVTKEQGFMAELLANHKEAMLGYIHDNYQFYEAAQVAHEKPALIQDTEKVIIETQKQGSMTDLEVMDKLRSTLNIEDIRAKLDKSLENHYIRTNLESFKEAKLEAKLPSEVIAIMAKEQHFLAGLHETIKYPDEQKDLQGSIRGAYNQKSDNVVGELEQLVQHTLTIGIKGQDEIMHELQNTTDLEATCINLDKDLETHQIQTTLNQLKKDKEDTKLPEEIIAILSKEQIFLAELHGNLKYPYSHQSTLLESITKAYTERQEQIVPHLQKTVEDAIEIGLEDKDSMVEELKNATDLKVTYIRLDRELESHHIQTNLSNFSETKQQAETAEETFKIITKEQEFLASLYENIKYKDQYPKTLLDSVAQAHLGITYNIIQELQNVTAHIIGHQVMNQQDLLKQLKGYEDVHAATKELTKCAKDHYSNYVTQNMNIIVSKQELEIYGHKFDCPLKYLNHEIANPAHPYTDIARFKKSIPRVQEQIKQIELKKELEFSIGGMSI